MPFDSYGATSLTAAQAAFPELFSHTVEYQRKAGYFHTLREICQQPLTWQDTAARLLPLGPELEDWLSPCRALALTGSGSSEYVCRCLSLPLQAELGLPVETIPGGLLLTHGLRAMLPVRPGAVVSVARSGDSPESYGAAEQLLTSDEGGDIRHLVITCNAEGRLARLTDSRVKVITLDDRTNDRSLVMTSSFTNLLLAGWFLGRRHNPPSFMASAEELSRAGTELLFRYCDAIRSMARSRFAKVIYLGSAPSQGAANETALKMLEMTAGRVHSTADSFLGLRHGPMSAVNSETLIVALFSSDPLLRRYEFDLIRELNRKGLGGPRLLVGEGIAQDIIRSEDVVIGCPALGEVGTCVLQVLTGQLLAFFRCLAEGLKPDSPSENGAISRVVSTFTLYPQDGFDR